MKEFHIGDSMKTLLCCEMYAGHFFHESCIDSRLRLKPKCPVCNTGVQV